MSREFLLPDLGEGIAEAQIIRVMVKDGDVVAEDQYIMEVETDKAAVEIPSPYAGVAKRVHVSEGQTVNVGEVIVTFDESAGGTASSGAASAASAATAVEAPPAPPKAAPAVAAPAPSGPRKTTSPAAPAVRRLARERGLDIDTIAGTGPGGRITKEDVERHAAGGAAPAAAAAPAPRSAPAAPLPGIADADKWGPIRREPINQIRKTIASQMTRSAYTAVHVTHTDEVDVTELERVRRELNELTGNDPKMTLMAFVIRATCLAIKKHPIFNSSFDEEGGQIVYKDYVNMGIAVDTERGLIVPVIRNVEQMSLRAIADSLRSLADRIRANQFGIEDLRGGTFTITNVGALGGLYSTPIINYPEVAILGLGRSRKVPAFKNGELVEALKLPINLSFDHRATDGANAARFAGDLLGYLEHPTRFLLD